MKKLADLKELIDGWRTQEGGEAGCVGDWIHSVLESADYDGESDEEKLELVKSSLAELKDVADYVLKTLEE